MDAVKILSISELLRLSRPLTGASSVHTSSSTIIIASNDSFPRALSQVNRKPQPSEEAPTTSSSVTASLSSRNPNPRYLRSLHHPTIIVGTLELPSIDDSSSSHSGSCCSSNNKCFSFSDGSGRVCCAVLDLDVKIIGKCIHVLAWNFLPFKCGSGFLEIIRWSLPDPASEIRSCSNIHSFPLVLAAAAASGLKARSRVHGRLASISPVLVVPCTFNRSCITQNNPSQDLNSTRNVSGFLVEVMVCRCKLCSSKTLLIDPDYPFQERDFHSYTNSICVYFFGSASSWHPAITKLLGDVIWLTGLKKKMVFMGKEESCLMFVTTEKTVLHLARSPVGVLSSTRTVISGSGDFGVYTGIITGIYMQGIIIELDEKVWLLMTDRLLSLPHPMRVGALISVRNVHFVHPNFSWKKMLLLGACFKTSIIVKFFSPFDSWFHIRSHNQSLLGKFIESLAFSVRLWVLLIVSCFKKKFAGMFSESEILGSKYKEGLVQKYAKSQLPSCVFQSRNGVLREFCKHDSCGSVREPSYSQLKLVAPISKFISHCEITWLKMLLRLANESGMTGKNNYFSLICEGKSYEQLSRRIMSSDNIGVVLMGTLQISPSSGRLQLIDATGSIDVVIPDLPLNWDGDSIYEVQNYNIVLEGLPIQVDPLELLKNDPFSCRNIFHHVPSTRGISNLAIYVHFYMRDATSINASLRLPSRMDWSNNHKGLEFGAYQLLLVTHKFPAPQNIQADPVISDRSSLFAEASILPWDLSIHEENAVALPSGLFTDKIKHNSEQNVWNYTEKNCIKRHKIAHASYGALPGLMNDFGATVKGSYGCLSGSVSPYKGPNWDRQTPPGKRFTVAVNVFNGDRPFRTGILSRTSLHGMDGKLNAGKIVLEFVSESFSVFQLLRIGGYYIIKYPARDLCNLKDGENVHCGKALITSKTPLWSLSFSCDEVSQVQTSDASPISDDAILCQGCSRSELPFLGSPRQSPGLCSDIHLLLSADVLSLLREEMKALEEQLILPVVIPGEAVDSTCIGTVGTAHVHDSRLPVGTLISLHGHVVAVHYYDCNHESIGDIHELRFFHGVISSICIHVSINGNIVKICGALSEQAYPIAMGPGVNATFHRILVMGWHKLMLTPVSFIVINSIKEVNHYGDTCFHLSSIESDSYMYNDASRDMVSAGLISELIQCLESKPMQLHCRVLAIHILILEKHTGNFEGLRSREHSKIPVVDIPLAGFVLDDGSTLCCCWANAERAAVLMRLNEEITPKALNRTGFHEAQSTTMDHLEDILKKHTKITVKNIGTILDFSSQDLAFSVNSDNALSSSEEDLLKFIVLGACCGSVLNVVGNLMDSSGLQLLEKELIEMDMAVHSMKNIWVREVQYMNPLAEARNMIKELIR